MAKSKKRKKGEGHLKKIQKTRKQLQKHLKNQLQMANEKQPYMYEWAPSAEITFSGQEYSIINNFIKSFETIDFNTGQLSKHQIYPVAVMQNKLRQMIEKGTALPVFDNAPSTDVATSQDTEQPTVTLEAKPESTQDSSTPTE